jgi:MFS family permease
MGFVIPFVAIIFDENGLSATEIAIVMLTSRIVQIITEIPSGAIADKYSRKYVLVVSRLLNGVPWILWILFPNFWGYLFGYIFFGLNMSLDSGCAEAFVYDELSKFKKRNLFERVLGRGESFASIGIFSASIVASLLVKMGFGYNFLLFTSFITTVISALVLLTIKPAKPQEESEEPESVLNYIETLKEGIKYSINHKLVLKFFLFFSFGTSIGIGINEYGEIFYNEVTNSLALVAIIFAISEVGYAIGSFSAEYLKNFSAKKLLYFYPILSLFNVIAFTLYSYPISIVLTILNSTVICAIYVNFQGKTNDLIPSKIRATTLSVRGFFDAIGTIICLILFGFVVDSFDSYRMGFLIFSIISLCGTLYFFKLFLNDKEFNKI